ncbi:hypothetical protein B7P43_G01351 [Cryptotermes secundus]|uniref:Gustatory receptor n=1 Tax=Cryptotermes secundus TaxID=105785 RepID=A0A2J7RE99_9NEOP|nr:hypothetical protein B7P43_G01351 [Cryptotermes secundus]
MDFRTSISPLYYVSKIIGIAPFSCGNKICVDRQHKNTNILPPAVVWSSLVFLFHLTSCMCIMVWSILYDYGGYTLSVTVPDAVTIFLMYSTCLASLAGAVLYRRRTETFIMNFIIIDQILLQENRDRVYRKTRFILLIELSLIFPLLIGFSCYHVYVWSYGTSYIYLIAKDMTNFSNIISVIQYINIMQILRHRFRILNKSLATSCDSKSPISNQSLSKHQHVPNSTIKSTTQIQNSANNLIKSPIAQNYFLHSELSMPIKNQISEEVSRVNTLRQAYSDLYDITELINKIYGYRILLEIAYNFVSLVSYLFYALEVLTKDKKTGDRNGTDESSIMLQVASSLCWVTQNMVRAFAVSASCFAASDEARRTGSVVHKLLLRQTLKGDTSAELQLFWSQLMSNKVEFTAAGFFTVNLSLVYSMVGAATTYIIILIQLN